MTRRNIQALIGLVVFYLGFGILLTVYQERFIYQPSSQDFGNCSALINAEEVTANGTRFYMSDSGRPVVVLYHGNAGSACDRAFYSNWITAAGYDFVLVEYTGYGGDTETPTHQGIKQDVRNVIEYLASNGRDTSAVIGESIGSGPASYHASLAAPPKLLLITPFTDLHALVRGHVWFYPTGLLVDNAFAPITDLATFRGQVTIIHGTADTVVPTTLGEQLYESLMTPNKRFVAVKEANHNDLFLFIEAVTAVQNFLGD